MNAKAVAYCRVSTDDQAREGVSLDAQRERIEAHCLHRRLELVEILPEAGVSGSKPIAKRPAGRRIAGLLAQHGAAHVVALKIDRLFRDTADALDQTRAWDKAGIALHVVDMGNQAIDTSSPMGRMMLTLIAAFAELERALIVDRTRTALRHKMAKGERVGSVPYGMRLAADGRTLEPDPRELETITAARRLRREGPSLRGIAAELRREGMTARKGGEFTAAAVLRMLEPARS